MDSGCNSWDQTYTQQMTTITTTGKTRRTPDQSQKQSGAFRRGRPKLIRNRQSSGSSGDSSIQPNKSKDGMGLLTITAKNMTDTEIDRIIEDAKKANKYLHIKDINGKVAQTFNEREEDIENTLETTELELLSNLRSSTELEQNTKEKNLRRSKRLTKTNPIVRLINPVPSDHRKYRQKAEQPRGSNQPGKQPGIRRKPELLSKHSQDWTVYEIRSRDRAQVGAISKGQKYSGYKNFKILNSKI